MKRMKIFMVVLLVFCANSLTAQGTTTHAPSLRVSPSAENGFYLVTVEGDPTKALWLRLKDADQHVLFSQKLKGKALYKKRFDFSGIGEGKYEFSLLGPSGRITESLAYALPAPRVPKVDIVPIQAQKRYAMSIDRSTALPVYLNLYDVNNTLVHEQKIDDPAKFRQTFNFEKYPQKYVTVIVESGDGVTFSQQLSLR